MEPQKYNLYNIFIVCTGVYEYIIGGHGLVVMTPASHAGGPEFEPRWSRERAWSSGYDVCLTRRRSRVRSSVPVPFYLLQMIFRLK
ncbi:conserved hypothetical protein [Theileria orientalis strain Shintoku]|uniref:Uncharacterized protein n=1 Tax=Theileria orientalis strain Shintoku TaxID=869250 RepID=J4D8H6_THEOR|nr:conserved hypothetical protein [Theileria orientalis strain Shintoku]PVC49976.1 hypothetical protein MACL_00002607 [Theileria orientalis]BAM40790.1 conserved hypothetical protein [Theileria orientalis strain Shintoku]|eukprot:XP_009691091.1 conserved hypothetical protein [Theileria orientalis strain Shintoku]